MGDVLVALSDGLGLSPVALWAGSTALPVTVNYATGNGSATAGADFTAGSGTLTFAPGVATQTITVPVVNDNVGEGTESFAVNLTGATNATVATGTGTGTITDNDTPTLTVTSPTVDESAGFAQFTVALSNPSSTATTVNLSLANGTATSGADFGPALQVSTDGGTTWTAGTSATIPAGATSVLVRTPVVDDTTDENSENFTLTATVSAGTTANASATAPMVIV